MSRFMDKISKIISFSKVLNPIYKSFLCLKATIIMLMNVFEKKITEYFQINSHVLMMY